MQITFQVPAAQASRVVDAMSGLHPQVLPGPQYTPGQWAKECIRRWIVDRVTSWEQRQAADAVIVDDGLVT